MSNKTAPPQTLESALQRVNLLVSEMEDGNLPLETLISRYEEGMALVRFCQEKLDAAEKRIEIITRDSRGKTQIEPLAFEDEEPLPSNL